MAAIGGKIGRQSTMSRIIKVTGQTGTKPKKRKRVLPTISDVPAGIRTKVVDIRRMYRKWGPQKNSIAASMIIAACGKNKANVRLVVNTMLRKPIHKQLRDTIRKQL